MAEQLAKLKAAIAKGDMPPDFRNKTDDELLALLASANELRSSDGSVPDGSAPEDTQCARCARATLPARGMHARPLRAGHVYTHPPCYAGGGRPDPEAKEVREVCAGHRREEQRLWERDPSKRRRCREADAAVSGEASGRRRRRRRRQRQRRPPSRRQRAVPVARAGARAVARGVGAPPGPPYSVYSM